MHLTELEWTLLSLGLEYPEDIAEGLDMDEEEAEARCEFMFQEHQFDETSHQNRRILEFCITNSKWKDALEQNSFDYETMIDLVDAAYSLEDRFAARFPLEPSEWFGYVDIGLDSGQKTH